MQYLDALLVHAKCLYTPPLADQQNQSDIQRHVLWRSPNVLICQGSARLLQSNEIHIHLLTVSSVLASLTLLHCNLQQRCPHHLTHDLASGHAPNRLPLAGCLMKRFWGRRRAFAHRQSDSLKWKSSHSNSFFNLIQLREPSTWAVTQQMLDYFTGAQPPKFSQQLHSHSIQWCAPHLCRHTHFSFLELCPIVLTHIITFHRLSVHY